MKKILLNIIILLCIATHMQAETQKEWLAVNPFQSHPSLNRVAKELTAQFRRNLINTKYYYVKSSNEQDDAVKKLQVAEIKAFERGELDDAVNLGKRLQVTRLLTGRLEQKDKGYSLNIALIDVTIGVEIYQSTISVKEEGRLKTHIAAEVAAINKLAKIEGIVLSSQDGKVNVSFNHLDPINSGQVIAIYRKKGQVLLAIGEAEIGTVLETQSIATILERKLDMKIRYGDIVKLSESKVNQSKLGRLKINSNTSWVTIEIDGVKQSDPLMEQHMSTFALSEGSHKVKAYKEGYVSKMGEVSIEADIEIKATEEKILTIELEKIRQIEKKVTKNAAIKYRSTLQDISMFIDGVDYGTQTFVDNIPLGKHHFTFKKHLYYDKKIVFEITESGVNNLGDITLKPNFAQVTLNSIPSGAKIWLNSDVIGETPFTANLKSNAYDLKLTKEYYYNKDIHIEVKDNTPIVQSFELKPHFGTLMLQVNPENSDIYINGSYYRKVLNKQMVRIEHLKSRKHKITVKHPHYKTETRYILLRDAETHIENIQLEPIFGTLSVSSKPKGSKVMIDEKEIGQTPLEKYFLDRGIYKLTVQGKNPGNYYNNEKNIEVKPNQHIQISDDLKKKYADLTIYVYKDHKHIAATIMLDGNPIKETSPITLKNIACGTHKVTISHDDKSISKEIEVLYQQDNKMTVDIDQKDKLRQVKGYFIGAGFLKANEDMSTTLIQSGLESRFQTSAFENIDMLLTLGHQRGVHHLKRRMGIAILMNSQKGHILEGDKKHPFTYEKMGIMGFASMDYHIDISRHVDTFIGGGISAGIINHKFGLKDVNSTETRPQEEDIRSAGVGIKAYMGVDWSNYCIEGGCAIIDTVGGKKTPLQLSSGESVGINVLGISGIYIKIMKIF
ncbi:MAG: PEGA domain-containing protein [bacterium]